MFFFLNPKLYNNNMKNWIVTPKKLKKKSRERERERETDRQTDR